MPGCWHESAGARGKPRGFDDVHGAGQVDLESCIKVGDVYFAHERGHR